MTKSRQNESPPERRELSRRLPRSRSVRAEDSRRADVILRSARGQRARDRRRLGVQHFVCSALDQSVSPNTLERSCRPARGRKARANAAALEAKVLAWTRRGPDDGSTHWSSRRLARKLGIGHMSVARIWRRHGLQPHRRRHFMASNDPAFEAKAADIISAPDRPPALPLSLRRREDGQLSGPYCRSCARRCVAQTAGTKFAELTTSTFEHAVSRQHPLSGLIRHRDHGSQYAADTFQQCCAPGRHSKHESQS